MKSFASWLKEAYKLLRKSLLARAARGDSSEALFVYFGVFFNFSEV